MSIFEVAYELTSCNEGGYANNPDDKGGETYKGIARKFWCSLHLWAIIDQLKEKVGTKASTLNYALAAMPEVQKAVKDFYRANFWDANNLSLVESQPVANWIYDHAVNAGARGVQWAQETAGVKADGQIGKVSIAAINAMPTADFLQKAKEVAGEYRLKKITADPSQKQFAKSWLRRDGFTDNEIRAMLA